MNARTAAVGVRRQLAEAGVPDAGFEAEILVREAAGLTRAQFFSNACLEPRNAEVLQGLTARRAAREPLAYLLGRREFYGIDFAVRPDVLIPRPETELLVDVALAELRKAPHSVVADIGTGSGCVAATIAAHAPDATVIATDRSARAIAIATRNFASIGVRVSAVRCDLAETLRHAAIVVANLPYIPGGEIAELEPEVRDWEPRSALDGGADGLELVRRLIDDCGTRLRPRLLALEVMAGQAGDVVTYATRTGAGTETHRDLAGVERVVTARWA